MDVNTISGCNIHIRVQDLSKHVKMGQVGLNIMAVTDHIVWGDVNHLVGL